MFLWKCNKYSNLRATQFFTMSWADVLSVFPPKGSQGPIIGFVSRNSDMRKPGSCKRPGPHAYLLSFISFRNNPDCEWEKNGEEHKGLWHSLSFWDLKTPRHDLDETQRFNLTVLQGFCAARSHARDFFPIASYTGAGHKGTGWLNRQWSAVHRRSDSFFRIFCVVLSFHLNERVLRFTLHLLLCFWCRGEREEVSEEWANKGFTKLWDASTSVNICQHWDS